MAVLDEANRLKVFAHALRLIAFAGLTKPQVRAALDATDQWQEDNSADFVAALPAAFRNGTNGVQKTLLFCYVAMRRAGILRTEGE